MAKFRRTSPERQAEPVIDRLVNLGALRRNPSRLASARTFANYRDCLLQVARRIAADGLELRDLTPQSDAFDRLMARESHRNARRHPRDAVGALLLDYDRWLCGRDEQLANMQRSQTELHTELDALRGERDGVANALKTVERVRESRDRYRKLAARAEAALLRTAPSDDPGSLESRLGLALRKTGFELPPRAARQRSSKRRNTAG